jgi:AGZA family xanthine/uracil permease-like MFS transporter
VHAHADDGADGEVEHLGEILAVDSVAAIAGGLAGTSSNTAYIESASGISDGARTGIASLVTGVLFLLAMFIAPLTKIVPYEAAAPALVIVGFLMMTQIRHIPFDDYGEYNQPNNLPNKNDASESASPAR